MGKQIEINLSEETESKFMAFVFSRGDVVLIYPWSEQKRLNIFNKLPKKDVRSWCVWNRKFKFKPEFVEIKSEYRKDKDKFVFSKSGAPVIEFVRSSKEFPGRLYWEKHFTHESLSYNVEEFEQWYGSLVRWIKRNCDYRKGVYV